MKPAELLHSIFQREIKRLHEQSVNDPLDVSDLVRLEKLVSSYRKFLPNDPSEPDEIDNLSTEELLRQIDDSNLPRKDAAKED